MPEWRIEQVADGVFARTGVNPLQPNSGIIVGDDGVLVVDSGYSAQAGRELLADIATLTPLPVTAVVISHHHFDHAWGNEVFAGAELIGHAEARRLMVEEPEPYKARMLGYTADPARWYGLSDAEMRRQMEETRITPPATTYQTRHDVAFAGPRVQLHHYGAGHTTGDTLVYLPDQRLLFAGDLVCNQVLPNAMDGDPLHWPHVLQAAGRLAIDLIVPGHGAIGDASMLREFDGCLSTLTGEVARALDQGAPTPRAASEQLHLGDLQGWSGQELLAGSVRTLYRALERARS